MDTATYIVNMSRETSGNRPTESTPGERIEPAGGPPDWLIRVVNPILKFMLRSPLHVLVSDHLLLITVTGHKSGTQYTFPVGYEREDGTVYITSFGTTWWKNLRHGGQDVTVHLGGERRTGHAEVETDDRAVAEYVHEYLQRHGADAAGQVGLKLPEGEVPAIETLEPAADHVVVVTIQLSDP